MTRATVAAALAAAILLAGCGRDDPPGALSADDERQLNEAAEMLDANAVDSNAAAPGADPEDSETDD